MKLKSMGSLLSRTYSQWSDHDAQTQGAALSYFTVLSLAPLLLIAVSIAGLVFGMDAARGGIMNQIESLTGSASADAIKTMLAHAQSANKGIIASIIGFLVLIVGASGVFSQLRKALNQIWEVKPQANSSFWDTVRQQLFSYVMVVGIGFLLLVSLVVSAALTATGKFLSAYFPSAIFQIVNNVFSVIVITLLFALIYRFVPDRTLPWRHLWAGSFATAVLFTLGKYLLGVYIGHASIGSSYGAAGSLVVLLVWVYYSASLFLFGAEFTRIYECQYEGVCLDQAPQRNEAPKEQEPELAGRRR